MKTNVLGMVGKGVCIGVLATFLVSCGEKTQTLTNNKAEPAWILKPEEGKKIAKGAPVVGTGAANILNGNISYATNQASMQARAQIAQSISTNTRQVIESKYGDKAGTILAGGGQEATRQKVDATLQGTEIVEKWIDKTSNPNVLHVLVSIDKDSYENAKKAALQGYKLSPEESKQLSDSIDDLLNRQ